MFRNDTCGSGPRLWPSSGSLVADPVDEAADTKVPHQDMFSMQYGIFILAATSDAALINETVPSS